MIKSFADKETRKLFETGRSRRFQEIQERAVRKLDLIDETQDVNALEFPPSNRLHRLRGNRYGQYSISINMKWRICFRFENGHAYDVEVCDYH